LSTKTLVFALFSLTSTLWSQPQMIGKSAINREDGTAKYLETVREQPSLLLVFLRAMPKGGDLHNHLSGAVYAESFINWAAEDGFCLSQQQLAFAPPPCDKDKGLIPAQQILTDPGLYQQVINAQSMRFFDGPGSGHDHFFDTFAKFGAISNMRQGDMLAEVASRAAAQNVSMLALMLAPDAGEAPRFASEKNIAWTNDLPAMHTAYVNAGIRQVAENGKRNLDKFEDRMRKLLNCGTPSADPGCRVMMRYQYEVHRGLTPEQVFAEMMTGFEMASMDSRVLNVNPVMPEDAYVETRDFDLHMRMFDYLKSLYPKVRLSLHAGELWPGLVPPDGLRRHIRDSIRVGHAERIGHGVDVMFEDNPLELLKEMAAKKIMVEINLTSNDKILGVRGDEHPLPMYLKFGVPVAISTDDEGVSRSDMTQEYWRAVRTYKLPYKTLKRMVRNSLEYSFLPGDSLWSDSTYSEFNKSCSKDTPWISRTMNPSCEQFLKSSERARAQWALESDFHGFESGSCCTAMRQ
jgi:adenosine deaminase